MNFSKIKVLLAKIGINGHDRGFRLIALALRDSGIEVVLQGPWAQIDEVVQAVVEEDPQILGISTLGGDYLLVPKLMEKLRIENVNVPVVVGGIIPPDWEEKLKKAGVSAVFHPGADLNTIADCIRDLAHKTRR